ncbi:MAG TPA: iron ABC transporter permease [Spirochaetales bacterium]|nr:iron ABC transporter permease [Spirochaetales bacterium]HRY56233.1 iron ABC transporter permease [Spirochaetia bacterium]HRZ65352.1 iron ABC transporter permease [Spirochaetia bacterium]
MRKAASPLWLAAALVALAALSLLVGRYPTAPFSSPWRLAADRMGMLLVRNVRAPRILAAVMLGASLGASGCAFQMLFGNPLADPGILGVSQGAAFGASLGIVLAGGGSPAVQLLAGAFAFLGLGTSYAVARRSRFGGWVLRLVLAGIAVSALFSSGVGALKIAADPVRQLPEITFWLLGGLSGASWRQVLSIAPVVSAALATLVAMRWRLNLLSLEDATAFSLGTAPARERGLLLAAAVAAVASAVSISGIVSWVGLIVPQAARRLYGGDARRSLPASALLGAIFTLLCDDIARSALPGEIPLGIITSLAGALAFIALMNARGTRIER